MVYMHQDTIPPEAGQESTKPTITVASKKWTRRLQLGPTQAYIGPDYACDDGPPSRTTYEQGIRGWKDIRQIYKQEHEQQAAPVIYIGRNKEGLPMRNNTEPCGHYLDMGWCYFGKECYYHHPHPSSKEYRTLKNARTKARTDKQTKAQDARSRKETHMPGKGKTSKARDHRNM